MPLQNRAFQFNDGAFETIIVKNGQIQFLEDHLLRLYLAAQTLRLNLPAELVQPEFMQQQIQQLLQANKLEKQLARVKLKIWRSGGGIYTPENYETEVLLTAQQTKQPEPVIKSCGIAESIRTVYSPLSFFKGPYALHYTLAGIEKTEKKLHEIILLDSYGHVAECSSSNIFWIRDAAVYTPSLQTGCIAGIMRKNIIKACKELKLRMVEGTFTVTELQQAETIFTANVTGIRSIANLLEQPFEVEHELLKKINLAVRF